MSKTVYKAKGTGTGKGADAKTTCYKKGAGPKEKQAAERKKKTAIPVKTEKPAKKKMVPDEKIGKKEMPKKKAAPAAAKPKKGGPACVIGRFFACLGTLLLTVLIFLISAMAVICHGPSAAARDLFVVSMMETSAAKFLPRLFFSEQEVQEILERNSVTHTEEVTNTDLVQIPQEHDSGFQPQAVELVDIKKDTFVGKMLIVHDPSRVYVATPPAFGADLQGMRVEEMVERDGALAGVNAGGFADEGGVGMGGEPTGLVITDSTLRYDSTGGGKSMVIGFDVEDHLVIGYMSAQQAMELKLRHAVSFGPALVINGEPTEINGTGGGLNPRTAIGQRQDGSVLLLVVDGRQVHSLGATYNDLVDVMLEYDAVNAANLDGGSSSLMIYEGKMVTSCASLYGSRRLPTAFLVK